MGGSDTHRLRSCQRMVVTMQGSINTLLDKLMDVEGDVCFEGMMPSDWAENVRDELGNLSLAIEAEIKIRRDLRGAKPTQDIKR